MREIRQKEAKEAYLKSNRASIIAACPRFGKIKTAIEIIKEGDYKSVVLLYPRVDILTSWADDLKKWGFDFEWEAVSTFVGLHKLDWSDMDPDLIIVDEIHEMSDNQLDRLNHLRGIDILGLSGTMTKKTRMNIEARLGVTVCYDYTIEQGVKEGILADYQLIIHKIKLDDTQKTFKKNTMTESTAYRAFTYIRVQSGSNRFMWDTKIINLLQNSYSRTEYTKKMLATSERVLVFCGTTNVADSLGIPVYHSKAREKVTFDEFCNGVGDKLAVIKMAQAGITIKPIHKGIINYTSGNPEDFAQKVCRFLGWEYDNPDKKAELHVLTSDTSFELERIKTALMFFDESKISWK